MAIDGREWQSMAIDGIQWQSVGPSYTATGEEEGDTRRYTEAQGDAGRCGEKRGDAGRYVVVGKKGASVFEEDEVEGIGCAGRWVDVRRTSRTFDCTASAYAPAACQPGMQ